MIRISYRSYNLRGTNQARRAIVTIYKFSKILTSNMELKPRKATNFSDVFFSFVPWKWSKISKRVFTIQYRIKPWNIKILISKIIFTRLRTKIVTNEIRN